MIFNKIKKVIDTAIIKNNWNCDIQYNIDKTKEIKFGDFSSNVAMILAKQLGISPLEIANKIKETINSSEFEKINVVKPGFINFFITDKDKEQILNEILLENDNFPKFNKSNDLINIEFVSANPTGLLHIGHARNAVFGDSLSRIILKYGLNVEKEYLINDAGNQMNKLAYSVLVRYKQILGINIELVEDAYHGEEIKYVAMALKNQVNDKYINVVLEDGKIIDSQINSFISRFSKDYLLKIINNDLKAINVEFDTFFSEKDDHKEDVLQETIRSLGIDVFNKDGAIWLNTEKYGDDKNRVLIKKDGTPTYFLPDIAYHKLKIERNKPKKLINIWGSDHHSYIKRMQIALEILGYKDKLDVVCMQLVRIIKDGKEFKLSKRQGNSLTLMDLVDTIGVDATRWFLISSSPNTHIELDINLALAKDNKNPIYYVQYAHVRAHNLIKKTSYIFNEYIEIKNLNEELERDLITLLANFKNIIKQAAIYYEPFRITNFLLNLSKLFHSYYSNINIIKTEDIGLQKSRAALINCVKIVISNGLMLLGIKPYTEM